MNIELYKVKDAVMILKPGSKQRNWMNKNPHAYRCVPLSIASEYGWDILLPEKVTLSWNGGPNNKDTTVLEGTCLEPHFGGGTVTLEGAYTWKTDEDIQMMVMPYPNPDQFDLVSLTAIIETDRLMYPWFLSCRLARPGTYTFPAGMPLARVIPIRIKDVTEAQINICEEPEEYKEYRDWQGETRRQRNPVKEAWQKFYHKVARYTSINTPKVGRK